MVCGEEVIADSLERFARLTQSMMLLRVSATPPGAM